MKDVTVSKPFISRLLPDFTLWLAPGASHHHHNGEHAHTHGTFDPEITSSARGLWAVKWSFVGLVLTGLVQTIAFLLSDSIALLADLIHNIADAATAMQS